MATTILECEQFAIVLLDTEGIDAVGASETMAMSLLTLTTLLSSYLIYNSKKVPQKVDLDKMRCFTQLSTSILAQRGDSMSTDAMKKFFPHFLWLLRDVTLAITNKQGEKISPTEFLHTRVLASESGHLTALGRFLCSLFPTLECRTLPMPTINPKVTRNIVELQDKLKPAFNTAVEKLIQQILQQVAPKKAIDGVSTVNGLALAALARGYVKDILEKGHKGLNEMSKILKMVPGVPQDVKIIGQGPDRVKLSWKPPKHNPEAAEEYIVSKREGDEGIWEEIKTAKKTKVLIIGLKSHNKYQFNVRATNSLLNSIGSVQGSETMKSKASNAAFGAFMGGFGSAVLGGVALYGAKKAIEKYDRKESKSDSDDNMTSGDLALIFGGAVVTLPISLLLAPVTVPLFVVCAAAVNATKSHQGDLTPVSDDEA